MYNLRVGVSLGSIAAKGFRDGRYRYEVKQSFEKNLILAKELGFDTVDVDVCTTYNPFELDQMLDEICGKIKNSGVSVNAFHMPFGVPWMDLTCPWEEDRVEMVKWMISAIEKMNSVNPFAYVFHPGTTKVSDAAREKTFDGLCRTANELAAKTDKVICIENMVSGNVLSKVDHLEELMATTKNVSVVLDVNHLLSDKPEDAILRLGKNIKTLHISDYDFVCERHDLPGRGKIEWNKVIGALDKTGYNGVFNYEVNFSGYTLADVKENYKQLFEKYNSQKC